MVTNTNDDILNSEFLLTRVVPTANFAVINQRLVYHNSVVNAWPSVTVASNSI